MSIELGTALASVEGYAPGPLGAPGADLRAGRSASLLVMSDSTGNETDEWVYGLAQWLGQQNPTCRVQYKLWSDANQDYGGWTVIQAGSAGERSIRFTGIATTGRILLPADVGDWTTDLDVRVKASMDDWTPTATQCLIARFGAAGARAFRLYVNTAGNVFFEWSPDGTALVSYNVASPGFTDGQAYWLRATLDVDNGGGGYTVTIYKSTDDGATWTQLGQSVTSAGTTSVFKPAATNYMLGVRSGADMLIGNIYGAEIRDGIGGPVLNPQPIESWYFTDATASTQSTVQGSPTLYVVNGAAPGQGISYFSDSTRLPKLAQRWAPCVVMLSTSHNDPLKQGATLAAAWDAWLTALKARLPLAAFCVLTQNPRFSPASFVEDHALRVRSLAAWAYRNGLQVIDTFKAFVLDGRGSAIIDADGIHPSTGTGKVLWTDTVTAAFKRQQY